MNPNFSSKSLLKRSTKELVSMRDELIKYTIETLDDTFDKELIAIEAILKVRGVF